MALRGRTLLEIFVQDYEAICYLVNIESLDLIYGTEFFVGCRQFKLAVIDTYFHDLLAYELLGALLLKSIWVVIIEQEVKLMITL